MDETRVLHVFGRMQPGGAEKRTLEIMHHLRPDGFICDVLALSGLPGSLDGEVEALGGTVHLLPRRRGWRGRLRALLHERRYQVVHSHVHFFSGVLLQEAAAAGVPVRIAHIRGIDDGKGEGLWRRLYRWWMRRLIDRYATRILAVSRAALTCARLPTDDARATVLYNGLDLGLFTCAIDRAAVRARIGLPAQARVVMNVANFTPPKNHLFMLRVFAAFARDHVEAHLVFIGRGGTPQEQEALAFIAQSGLASRIHVLGSRDDVPELLRVADVFLFASRYEGLPGALLEACAVGLPCLASAIEPCREVAERLPQVVCLGLERPLEEWTAGLAHCVTIGRDDDGERCRQRLALAGFDVTQAAAAIRLLWRPARAGVPSP